MSDTLIEMDSVVFECYGAVEKYRLAELDIRKKAAQNAIEFGIEKKVREAKFKSEIEKLKNNFAGGCNINDDVGRMLDEKYKRLQSAGDNNSSLLDKLQ